MGRNRGRGRTGNRVSSLWQEVWDAKGGDMRFLALGREARGKCFGYLLTGDKDTGGGGELACLPHFAGQMDKLASGRNKKSDPNCNLEKERTEEAWRLVSLYPEES